MEKEKKYFTITTKGDGAGDFFKRWIVVYTILTNLGYTYLYTKINLSNMHTSKNSNEILNILGFNEFPILECKQTVNIPLDTFLTIYEKKDTKEVKKFLQKMYSNKVVLSFSIKQEDYSINIRKKLREIRKNNNFKPNMIILKENYHKKNVSNKSSKKMKIVVHIRRGDVAQFKVGRKTISASRFKQKYFTVKQYLKVLTQVMKKHEGTEQEI
ncbi:MAG: hypothetical protein ACMXYK_01855 [Candidatus Woesearchaeota archaeon]